MEAPRVRAGDAFAAGDDVNRLISAANAALYGLSHAVIVGLGASPGLGFVHSGTATSFVQDIADLYKVEYSVPLAFDLAARGLVDERDARVGLRELIVRDKLLGRIVDDVKSLLSPEGTEVPDIESNELWDERTGTVAGGVNYGDEDTSDLVRQASMGEDHIAVVGPEFDTEPSGQGGVR